MESGVSDASTSVGHSGDMRRDHASSKPDEESHRVPGTAMKGKHHGGEAIAEINNQADKSPRWGSPSSSRVSWGRPSPEVIGRESRSARSGRLPSPVRQRCKALPYPGFPLSPLKPLYAGQLIDALNGETALGSPKPYFPHPDAARAARVWRDSESHASMLLYFHAFMIS